MRNQSARRRQANDNQSNIQNTNNQIVNIKKLNDDPKEEEQKEEIEEEIEDGEEPKKITEKKDESEENQKVEKKEEEKELKKKEDKKETDPKIVIQIKKNETINSNNKSNKSNNSMINKSNNSINNKSNSIHNKSNNSISSRNNSHNSKNKIINNNNNNIISKNINNIDKKNSSCQVNLISDDENAKFIQTLKLKINNLTKDKQKLIEQANTDKKNYDEQISQKKQEIMSLSQINAKLRINLEKVSNQVNKLLEKAEKKNSMQKSGSTTNLEKNNKRFISSTLNKYKLKEAKNKIFSNEENKDKDEDIESLKEKLNMKESQLKNSLSLIEFLRKDNKKLKKLSESFGNENLIENNNINNYKLIEEIKKKNKEINQLEKAYKEIVSIKTPDKELEYYKNQVLQLKEANSNNEATIKKLRIAIAQNKEDKKLNLPNSPIINARYKLDNMDSKNKISQNIKDHRSSSVINSYDWRNTNLNKNFGKLLNEKEKNALLKLFESEEEFKNFNKKLNVIDNHYNAIGKRYETTINELKETIKDKDEQIAYLREKIRENEMKIKILMNKFHLERQKNDKSVPKQQEKNSTKAITKSS